MTDQQFEPVLSEEWLQETINTYVAHGFADIELDLIDVARKVERAAVLAEWRRIGPQIRQAKDVIEAQEQRIATLEAQRDQLLAALKMARASHGIDFLYQHQRDEIDAAIAAAQEGSSHG